MKWALTILLTFFSTAQAEQVGLRIDLEKRQLKMIVVDSEFQDAMGKVVKIMQAAETATLESSPGSFVIKSSSEQERSSN